MTPDLYWQESLKFRAKAAAVVNDPELKACYERVADSYAKLSGYIVHKLESEPAGEPAISN